MSIVEKLGRQPRGWLMLQSIAFLAVVVVINVLPSWRGNMLIFYCLPVYVVAVYFPRRVTFAFVFITAVVATVARVDMIGARGLGHYAWTALNRTGGLFFAAACGILLHRYREEVERRIKALERLRTLELEVVRSAELERQKIGQDLHDSLCQTLVALDCAVKCLKLDLEADGSPRTDLAAEIQKQMSDAALEARSMARGIFPVALSAGTLPSALQELATTLSRLWRGAIAVQIDPDLPNVESHVAQHLYRIAQEALSNALRHAAAKHIEVTLRETEDMLVLAISDDGRGFAAQQLPEGMGLHTMRYRANLIGARLTVNSQPSGGTKIVCELPSDCTLRHSELPIATEIEAWT